jgi:hypothetical protein
LLEEDEDLEDEDEDLDEEDEEDEDLDFLSALYKRSKSLPVCTVCLDA